jgi:hypothetical protein
MTSDCFIIEEQDRYRLAEYPTEPTVTVGFAFIDLGPFGMISRNCFFARCGKRWWHLRECGI